MKLLALYGFLFVLLLCLNAFTAEGRKVKKVCCSKLAKVNKKATKGVPSKTAPVQTRKYCKPCAQPDPLRIPGPLPRLK